MFKLIQSNQEPGGAVAKLEADLVPFISLGEITHAVILRLSSDLPRIRCETFSTGGELENASQ